MTNPQRRFVADASPDSPLPRPPGRTRCPRPYRNSCLRRTSRNRPAAGGSRRPQPCCSRSRQGAPRNRRPERSAGGQCERCPRKPGARECGSRESGPEYGDPGYGPARRNSRRSRVRGRPGLDTARIRQPRSVRQLRREAESRCDHCRSRPGCRDREGQRKAQPLIAAWIDREAGTCRCRLLDSPWERDGRYVARPTVGPTQSGASPLRTRAIAFSSLSLAIVRYLARLSRSMSGIERTTSGARRTPTSSSTASDNW